MLQQGSSNDIEITKNLTTGIYVGKLPDNFKNKKLKKNYPLNHNKTVLMLLMTKRIHYCNALFFIEF